MALYFPAPKWDGTSYKQGSPEFGHRRKGKKGFRDHAACDLYAPLESDVVAVDDGYVVEFSIKFAGPTQALALFHRGIGVIRYGEIVKVPVEYRIINTPITAGTVIGKVGRAVATYPPMLHLELFDGSGSGPLSDRVHKIEYTNEDVEKDGKYERRGDLMNPTKLIDRLWLEGKK